MNGSDNVYVRNGYENRKHYLKELADAHELPLSTVWMLADLLGPSEDFDGLVTSLEDMEDIDM